MKIFNINDNYFKYKKCVSGITYQFVNQLDNIYEKNLMVGTNYCIYCMYNEFDIIKNFMVNLNQVDICVSDHLDISKRYYELDGAYLKTGHKVLLVNQNDPIENDIYIVNTRGYLILSDELSTSGETWRYKAYIKLGNNKGKQFHLINSGNRFPLKGERKYFLDGHGYIIKNVFNYDVFDTGMIPPKLIFTDYEMARISVNKNCELYDSFELPDLSSLINLNINYHGNDYIINVESDTTKYLYDDIVSGTTIYNSKDFPLDDIGYKTHITAGTNFLNSASEGDYIRIQISGDTSLNLDTFIHRINADNITISDYISDDILNYYYNYTGSTSTYYLKNLMYSSLSEILDIMLSSYYSQFFQYNIILNRIEPKENTEYLYFDYDGLSFIFSGITTDTYNFNTDNYYIDYKLYDTLNRINPSLFNTGYSFLIDFNMLASDFDIEYYDNYPNVDNYPTTLGDIKGTYIKIIPHTPSYVNYFKKYTYLNLNTIDGSFKTLITDVKPNEYILIESYKSNSGLTEDVISIDTIYNLKEISDILYDVYINDETPNNIDYYRLRNDNIRKDICNGYAQFISEDLNIITYTTAFLMTDNENKFILKVYDPENLYNGGVIRPPVVNTKLNIYKSDTWAILPGEVMNDGGSNITSIGVCYTLDPTFLSDIICDEVQVNNYIGEFEINVSNLFPSSTYYYKAFAENEHGRSYGNIEYFETDIEPLGLELTFNDILNVPMAEPTNVDVWNTFFDLPTYGTPFILVEIDGNTVKLYGGSGITIKSSLFGVNTNLVSVVDKALCVVEVESFSFRSCSSCTLFKMDALITIGDSSFEGCSSIEEFSFASCVNLGSTTGDNNVFIGSVSGIYGQTINLTVPSLLMTCNGGFPDGDIQILQTNNTVTIIEI